jgi:putative transposase
LLDSAKIEIGKGQSKQRSKLMNDDNLILHDREVLAYAHSGLQAHLALRAAGYKVTSEALFHVLLGAAAGQSTVQAVCRKWTQGPHPETIRRYLKQQVCVAQMPHLQAQLNAALAAQIPLCLYQRAQPVAIDLHDEPYYGKQSQASGLWVRSQRQRGTSRFYRIASAYVMVAGLRITLALHFVRPDQDHATVVQHLLDRLAFLRVRIATLYLDKGFASVAVMRQLAARRQPTLLATPIRGKTGGTRALCRGRRSYVTTHTFCERNGDSYTATVAVCRVFTTAKRTGRSQRQGRWLLFVLIQLALPPGQARRRYRRRFGIESSYRCARTVKGWTTSPNPAYRFLLLALAFYLLNVWIALRWRFAQCRRRGRRHLDEALLPLARIADFLVQALDRRYQARTSICAHAPPIL